MDVVRDIALAFLLVLIATAEGIVGRLFAEWTLRENKPTPSPKLQSANSSLKKQSRSAWFR